MNVPTASVADFRVWHFSDMAGSAENFCFRDGADVAFSSRMSACEPIADIQSQYSWSRSRELPLSPAPRSVRLRALGKADKVISE